MQLLRRSVRDEASQARERRRVPRGAWYSDPFGVGDERWWDGSRWTREVRSSAEAESAAVSGESAAVSADPPSDLRPLDGSGRGEKTPEAGSGDPRASEFPLGIEAVVGEQLSVMPSTRKPGMHCHMLAVHGRVGSISVFGHHMARLTCAHGAWILKTSRRNSRESTIESVDHHPMGLYLQHQWMPGGTIRLQDGTEVELRRSLPRRWKLCSADGSRCLAEVRQSVVRSAQPQELKVTIHTLPPDAASASLLILAACALLVLPADSR